MTRQVFSSGEEVTYTKMNNVSNQTLIQADSATRQGMTSVNEGMVCYDTDLTAFMYFDGSDWQLQAPLALLRVGVTDTGGPTYSIDAGGTGVVGYPINGASMLIGPHAGEGGRSWRYALHWNFNIDVQSDADRFTLYVVRDDGTPSVIEHREIGLPGFCDTYGYPISFTTIDTPGNVGVLYYVEINRTSGSTGGARVFAGTDCWAELFDMNG